MNGCFEYAMDTHPMPGENCCGDTGFILQNGHLLQATLVDVLGHGEIAAELAGNIRQKLAEMPVMPPAQLLLELHETFRGSRGFVASSMCIDGRNGHFDYCGIGNIQARIAAPNPRQLVNRDGVLGYRIINPSSHSGELADGSVLIMHSDGLSSRFHNDEFSTIACHHCQHILAYMFRQYDKHHDDSSCMVIRWRACS